MDYEVIGAVANYMYDFPPQRPSSQEVFRTNESVLVVRAAIDEASKLTSILSTSTSALSRSVSSVGEHHSSYFVATPVPKRAETFAGFDSNHESPKRELKKRLFTVTCQKQLG